MKSPEQIGREAWQAEGVVDTWNMTSVTAVAKAAMLEVLRHLRAATADRTPGSKILDGYIAEIEKS
jgi:hypothetical protein